MKITKHEDLEVFKIAYKVAMEIFNLTLTFPKEEKYSLTDQIRKSSRSVSANIAEAFYRRKYPKNFASRLSDSIAEAAETKVWLDFAFDCQYLNSESKEKLKDEYSKIIGKLITMCNQTDQWKL